jgi:glutathione synthase/RimK-type ligase-like ATP-grasp enzyme
MGNENMTPGASNETPSHVTLGSKNQPRSETGLRALILNGPTLAAAVTANTDLEVTSRTIDDLAFLIETSSVSIRETVSDLELSEFALVQMAGYPRPTASLINGISEYLESRGVSAINMAGIGAPTKLVQYLRLAQAGLPVPRTVYLAPNLLRESYHDLARQLDLPFIIKALSASGGRYNYLVRTEADHHQCLVDAVRAGVSVLAQEFIPNDATYRLILFGRHIALAIRREWAPGTHLSNTAQGSMGALVEPASLGAHVEELARTSAAMLGYEVAGVNLVQDWATESWYVLGVDANPALTTGVFVDQKVDAYRSFLRERLTFNAATEDERARDTP